nr:MAG TPA_asm: envelope glycoprotein [Bacteriophage sp.]
MSNGRSAWRVWGRKVFLPTYTPPEKMVKTLFCACGRKRWRDLLTARFY